MYDFRKRKGGLASSPFFIWAPITIAVMAILGKGILDGFTGKMDGLVGQKRNGHSTISQYRDGSDINWSLQTDAQRTRMSFLSSQLRKIPEAIRNAIWAEGPDSMSTFLKAIQANYKDCSTSAFVPTSNFVKYHSLPPAIHRSAISTWPGSTTVTVAWSATMRRGKEAASDIPYILFYLPNEDNWFCFKGYAPRSTAPQAYVIGARPNGTPYYTILIFVSADGKLVSEPIVQYKIKPA